MAMAGYPGEQTSTAVGAFATTHWSVVINSTAENSSQALPALEKLVRAYWYPLYAYVRRRGYDAHSAEDMTQEFFARLIQSKSFVRADPTKGRFRSWLLGAMNHFLAHEWEKAQTQKRGGGSTWIGLDEADADGRYQRHLMTETAPEQLYDQQWALTILERATTRLQASYVADGRPEIYERLKTFVSGGATPPSYAEAGARVGLSEAAVKSAVYRLRQRFQELIREEVAETVGTAADLDEELRYLIAVIRSD